MAGLGLDQKIYQSRKIYILLISERIYPAKDICEKLHASY